MVAHTARPQPRGETHTALAVSIVSIRYCFCMNISIKSKLVLNNKFTLKIKDNKHKDLRTLGIFAH